MIVLCNSCQTKYSVDERKIPASGVKVKCRKCQNIIIIKPPDSAVAAAPSVPKPEPPKPTVPEPPKPTVPEPPKPTVPEPPETTMPDESPEPSVSKPVDKIPEEPAVKPSGLEMQGTEYQLEKTEKPSVSAPEATPSVSTTSEEDMSEEDKKWHQRAKRLAKALASDLVLYNQSKVEEGLRNNTLAKLLGSEIRRSWEYYCQQIPKKIVENSDYFKEQLNKIVGKGKEIFK